MTEVQWSVLDRYGWRTLWDSHSAAEWYLNQRVVQGMSEQGEDKIQYREMPEWKDAS